MFFLLEMSQSTKFTHVKFRLQTLYNIIRTTKYIFSHFNNTKPNGSFNICPPDFLFKWLWNKQVWKCFVMDGWMTHYSFHVSRLGSVWGFLSVFNHRLFLCSGSSWVRTFPTSVCPPAVCCSTLAMLVSAGKWALGLVLVNKLRWIMILQIKSQKIQHCARVLGCPILFYLIFIYLLTYIK